jgi:hypothetical protein
MRTFMILPVGGGTSYKVEVSHPSGGVRIVGGFRSAAEAMAWVAHERGETTRTEANERSD